MMWMDWQSKNYFFFSRINLFDTVHTRTHVIFQYPIPILQRKITMVIIIMITFREVRFARHTHWSRISYTSTRHRKIITRIYNIEYSRADRHVRHMGHTHNFLSLSKYFNFPTHMPEQNKSFDWRVYAPWWNGIDRKK